VSADPRPLLRATLRRLLEAVDLRLVRLAPDQVRGHDPFRDLAWLLRRRRHPVIIDAGANDGETVEAFRRRFPSARILAFEPFGPSYQALRRRFRDVLAVETLNLALGAAAGTARLHLYSGHRMNSLLRLDPDPENPMSAGFAPQGEVTVPVATVDGVATERKLSRIDILKIDTQGYDLEVLHGAAGLLAARRVGAVLLEVNFVPMYERQASFPELHAFLSGQGYRLVDFYNHQRTAGLTAWCDACYAVGPP
jgi:FkbM family methyltransferase